MDGTTRITCAASPMPDNSTMEWRMWGRGRPVRDLIRLSRLLVDLDADRAEMVRGEYDEVDAVYEMGALEVGHAGACDRLARSVPSGTVG